MKKQEDKWKLPPPEKIYEAFSVLADGRYELTGEGNAFVTSSAGDKKYRVYCSPVNDNQIRVRSDDNGSRWQGYTGYPIIAILMITGYISYNHEYIRYFKGIPWKQLNKAHKNNYAAAVEEILEPLQPELRQKIKEEINTIFIRLRNIHLVR